MKKQMISLILGVIFLTGIVGCRDENQPSEYQFSKVEYCGHTYIVYDGIDFDSGMVHDPDCKCRK